MDRFLAFVSAFAFFALANPGAAQDWKAKYKELSFAIIPAENATSASERFEPLAAYLAKELGVPVKLKVASDYAGAIEALRTAQVQIAYLSPASYSRAYIDGVKVEPFAIETNGDGSKSYYSVLYVRSDSPYQKIEDLKGKRLGLVDPNSTSGNNMPRFMLDKMGIDPETFFANVQYTGSHENSIIALQNGQVDVAANAWTNADDSFVKRMESKGLAKSEDFRIILKSDPIVNAPMTYLSALPDELKKEIRDAIFSLRAKDRAVFDKVTGAKSGPMEAVDASFYDDTIKLVRFVDSLRKKRR